MISTTAQKKPGEEQVIPISKSVSYHYIEQNGGKTVEALVTSKRLYPGMRINGRFYYGLHQGRQFIPGIVWCKRFIPGVVSSHGFLPGLIRKKSFVPGIVAMKSFVPGIVKGNLFKPGIVSERRFLPGCFTNDKKFVPGRFLNGRFENGVMENSSFILTNCEKISSQIAHGSLNNGYGMGSLKQFDAVGGLPIGGIVVGTVSGVNAYIPEGLLTDRGVIIGGLWDKEDLPVTDITTELGEMGFDVNEDDEVEDLLGDDGEIEKWIEDLLPNGIHNGEKGSLFNLLSDGLAALSEGSSEVIDKLNQSYDDYWQEFVNNSSIGGVIASGGSQSGNNNQNDWHKEAEKWVGVGIVSTTTALGTLIAGGIGAAIGAAVGEIIVDNYVDDIVDFFVNIFGSPASDDTGTSTNSGGFMPGAHPAGILMPRIKRKTVIEISQNIDGENSSSGNTHSAVKVVQTDSGAMAIINFGELAKAGRMTGERGVSIGLNPLTGTAVLIPGNISGSAIYEQSKMSYWLNPVARPIEA